MKVLKNATVYKCEYCGKVSLRKNNILQHEECCRKNPKHFAICYHCAHFEDGSMEIPINYEWMDGGYHTSTDYSKMMTPHRCQCENSLLFNRFHMRDHLSISLEGDGWKPMPTKLEGCCNFKEREEIELKLIEKPDDDSRNG